MKDAFNAPNGGGQWLCCSLRSKEIIQHHKVCIGQLADLRCCTGTSDRDLILLPVGRFSSVKRMCLLGRLSGALALREDPKFDAPSCTEDSECYCIMKLKTRVISGKLIACSRFAE